MNFPPIFHADYPPPDLADPFASLHDLRNRPSQPQDDQHEPLQFIQLTPWTPPPRVIQPSTRFPPPARLRLMRSPSLSTITDRRESGSYVLGYPSTSSLTSSSSGSHPRPSLQRNRRSSSSSSTSSSESHRTQSTVDAAPQQEAVRVQSASPEHSFVDLAQIRRSASLPRLPSPLLDDSLPSGQFSTFSSRRLRKKDLSPDSPFDPIAPLTPEQLQYAASLNVIGQDGQAVTFGSLFQHQKTIICFLRHFWCPLCQDYMYSIMREADPEALDRAGVKLVIISHGSPNMIRSYRQIFRMPSSIPLYTDPSRALYHALGMTFRTLDPGPEEDKGDYVRHGQISGIGMVVLNALKSRMPIMAKGGDVKQLGGEFILGPGLACWHASRMQTTRSHMSISYLLKTAGVDTDGESDGSDLGVLSPKLAAISHFDDLPPKLTLTFEHLEPLDIKIDGVDSPTQAEDNWMRKRRADLKEICQRRSSRRGNLEHLRWVGDCGLYDRGDSPPQNTLLAEAEDQIEHLAYEGHGGASHGHGQTAQIRWPTSEEHTAGLASSSMSHHSVGMHRDLNTIQSDQMLNATYLGDARADAPHRARTLSDPGPPPGAVVEWLAKLPPPKLQTPMA